MQSSLVKEIRQDATIRDAQGDPADDVNAARKKSRVTRFRYKNRRGSPHMRTVMRKNRKQFPFATSSHLILSSCMHPFFFAQFLKTLEIF